MNIKIIQKILDVCEYYGQNITMDIERFEEALNNNNIEEATKLFSEATKKIDQACTKGIIVKNTAARKKSNLAKKLNAAKA